MNARSRNLLAGLTLTLGLLTIQADGQQGIKLGYINKLGDLSWFVAEVQGAKDKAKALGVNLLVQDVQSDANLTITAMDTMIADGVQGIAIVVPDTGLGPTVIDKARKAGIPLIAVDDDIKDKDGKFAPYVGLDGTALGQRVGTELGKQWRTRKWNPADTRILSFEIAGTQTCMDRTRGAEATFRRAVPNFPQSQIIRLPYDGGLVSALDAAAPALTANANAKNWIIWSCNDNGVLGGVRATENAGIEAANVMGYGIDGSMACDAFKSGKPTGFEGTLRLESYDHGASAINLLFNNITKKQAIPARTISTPVFINKANFAGLRSKLGCP